MNLSSSNLHSTVNISINQHWEEMGLTRKQLTILFLCLCFTVFLQLTSVSSSTSPQGQKETASSRSFEHEKEVHCSRERSRAAWKIIDEYLMPFVEKERYKISSRCRLHPENDLYRDQEQHKMHVDINEWRCGYCKKTFYEEKYLDKHFDNRHYDLLNVKYASIGYCQPQFHNIFKELKHFTLVLNPES